MKKRLLSLVLVLCMVLAMCAPIALADTERIGDHYPAPYNARWSGYTMNWDWNGERDDYFEGFEVYLYYSNSESEPDEVSDWSFAGGRLFWDAYTPSLTDFEVTVTGWYSFEVCAFGSEWYTIEGEDYMGYREYASPVSERSGAVWFETQPPVASPTNLRWDGTTMIWDAANTTNIGQFAVQPCYMTTDYYEDWITTDYVKVEAGKTTYSIDLEDMGVDEQWLLNNGTQTYYFRVQAISSDITVAANADWVTGSETMTFNAEAEKLQPPSNLRWEGYTMAWDLVNGTSYDVTLYFLRDLTQEELEEIEAAGGSEELNTAWEIKTYRNISSAADFPVLSNEVMWGPGNYYFTVKTRSNDLSQYRSSDWSEASSSLHMDGFFSLPVPTDLGYDEATGAITWSWAADAEQTALLSGFEILLYYRANQDVEPTVITWLWSEGETSTTEWKSYADQDGYYSFEVLAVSADGSVYDTSDQSVRSEEFYYDAPDPLPAPTGVAWVDDTSTVTWTGLADTSLVSRYLVRLYYCGVDGMDEPVNRHTISISPEETSFTFTGDYFSMGDGVYKVRVRAFSADTTKAANGTWSDYTAAFTYTKPSNALAAPTGLYWENGTMKWEVPENAADIAYYEVYVYGDNNRYSMEVDPGDFPAIGSWAVDDLGDNITFKVRAISGDVNKYLDSEWVVCKSYYVAPARLPVATNLTWSGSTMTWSWDGDYSQLDCFNAYLYYVKNEYSEPEFVCSIWSDDTQIELSQWGQYVIDSGVYYFTVRAFSRDTSVIGSSNESELSSGYSYEMPERLAAPTNVAWDGSVATWTASSDEELGLVDYYRITLYNNYGYVIGTRYCYDGSGRRAISSELFEGYGAGNYTFSVVAVSADASQRSNSDKVVSDSFTYTPHSDRLAAPTNLRWKGSTMVWDVPENAADIACYEVNVYGDNDWFNMEVAPGDFPAIDSWDADYLGDNIKFRVRAISSDANEYLDSEWAACETEYEPPAALPTPTNLQWDENGNMSWSWSGSTSQLRYYIASLYYAEDAETEPVLIESFAPTSTSYAYSRWVRYNCGPGLYFFTVRAYSKDTGLAGNSVESDFSSAYVYDLQSVGAPSSLRWVGSTLYWVASADHGELVSDYRVSLYYCDAAGNDIMLARTTVYGDADAGTMSYAFPTAYFENCGNGTYKVSVVAVSNNYKTAANSKAVWSGDFTYKNPGVRLDAPTNLCWEGSTMKWDVPADSTDIACYEVYVYGADNWYSMSVVPGDFPAIDSWAVDDLGDKITFEVRAISSDANKYLDSDYVVCGTYYVPTEALPTPTDLQWDESGNMSWSWAGSVDLLSHYSVSLYYAENADSVPEQIDSFYIRTDKSLAFDEWAWYNCGPGLYFFTVRAYSNDTGLAGNSVESGFSPAYVYTPDSVGAPSNLRWEGSTLYWDVSEDHGALVNEYMVSLCYCNAAGNDILVARNTVFGGADASTMSYAFPSAYFENWGNGTYRVCVVAMSNQYQSASNSKAVWNGDFTYVDPGVRLDAPTNLRWEGTTMKWDVPADTSGIACYIVELYNPDNVNGMMYRWSVAPGEFKDLQYYMVNSLGTTLAFRVKAVSADANKANDSTMTVCTVYYTYTGPETLETPQNLVYDPDSCQLTWNAVDNADYYTVKIYYAETADEEQALVRDVMSWSNSVYYEVLDCGYFTFVVQAYSYSGFAKESEPATYTYSLIRNLPALDAPTELSWGRQYDQEEGTYSHLSGVLSWKTSGVNQGRYRVRVYKVGEELPYSEEVYGLPGVGYTDRYIGSIGLTTADMPSGTYYFTVQALGDKINYCNSAVAKSEELTYVNPGVKLNTPTDLHWDGSTMCWSADVEEDDCYGVQAFVYYSDTLDGERSVVYGTISGQYCTELALRPNESGYYWFEVRILSGNKDKVLNSEYSVMSPAYYYPKAAESVSESLSEIVPTGESVTDEEVKDAVEQVKEMNTEDLANAMAAEQDENNNTLALIEALEDMLKETGVAKSDIGVDEAMKDTFNAENVSVVGAALNAPEEGGTVTLSIGGAGDEVPNLNPALYTSTVQFSLHLNLTDESGSSVDFDADPDTAGQQLAVPVCITLPVPANINPAFLVVLHYLESEDRYEEIWPSVYCEDGQWYASFVVTSFSDFALASVTISAETVDNGVAVNVKFAVDLPGSAICAVYDAEGRQIGVTVLDEELTEAGNRTLNIECDPEKAASVKLFILDENGVPAYVESPCQIGSNG